MKGNPHYIEADLNEIAEDDPEGWVFADWIELELLLKKHAAFLDFLNKS
jgi:hypothetical protein